jgi:hypothetical protein
VPVEEGPDPEEEYERRQQEKMRRGPAGAVGWAAQVQG